MNYEKEYEEAVKRAKAMIRVAEKEDEVYKIAITIFPELKEESEDEKIRKQIKAFIKSRGSQITQSKTDAWIDWLEKQGKSNPYSGVSFKYNGHTWGMCARDNGVEILVNGEIKERVSLDKKPQGKTALEAAKEEKVDNQNCVEPIDKVEQKYEIIKDTWYICTCTTCTEDSRIWFKKGVAYLGSDILKYDLGFEPNEYQDYFRLWTIQDAKDGEVLCTYECCEPKIVFILKGTPKKHYALSYYCYYNIMYPHFASDSEKGCLAPNDEDVKPATKEQRNTLFKAMAEAGWEFDFEKKELKNIENEIEIPFGAKDSELQEATYYIPKGFHAEIDDDKVVIKKGEKPTAWSEEDEKRIASILSVLSVQVCWDGATGKKMNPYQKEIDWLKSLKDRVQTLAKIEKGIK